MVLVRAVVVEKPGRVYVCTVYSTSHGRGGEKYIVWQYIFNKIYIANILWYLLWPKPAYIIILLEMSRTIYGNIFFPTPVRYILYEIHS